MSLAGLVAFVRHLVAYGSRRVSGATGVLSYHLERDLMKRAEIQGAAHEIALFGAILQARAFAGFIWSLVCCMTF